MKKITEGCKKIIVSFSSKGREDYNIWQERLHKSIIKHWDGDYWLHSLERDGLLPDTKQVKYKPHSECPYQFKLVMIDWARDNGYNEVYWLDSSLVLAKDITGLANPIMAFHNLGHDLYKYISDTAQSNLAVTDEELKRIEQTWGGAIGFNFASILANRIFNDLIHQSQVGSFNEGTSTREGFVAHRHDQAVMSVLFHIHNIPLLRYGNIVTYPHCQEPYEYGKDYYIIHKRLNEK
jgi:hypothetical protein